MANETVGAPAEGTAPVNSLEDAFNAAQTEVEGTGAEETQSAEVPSEEGTTVEAAEVPEHIKWVKSIDGDTDKETGEIVVDRVAKRAFELNKQNQTQAQQLAQLKQVLNNPEVQKAVLNAVYPNRQPEKAVPETTEPKTDEEILKEYVSQIVKQNTEPIIQQNQLLYQEYAKNQIMQAHQKLTEAFGKTEDGTPVYNTIGQEVLQQLGAAAQRAGVSHEQFLNELIRQGTLYQTLEATGKTIMYGRMKEKLAKLESSTVQAKKKTNLTKPGSPSSSVNAVKKEVSSIMEAYAQAEADNPEFAKLL